MATDTATIEAPRRSESAIPSGLASISQLSDEEIRESMSREDLIAVIRGVDYPFAGKDRLEFFDRDTLERVVCLVRRWSLHQLGVVTL